MPTIASSNEWDQLREIVVGSATGANWPSHDPVFALESERTSWHESPVPSGPVPDWVIDEANEDLDALCDTLVKAGVKVHRPSDRDFVADQGMYNYCPRDRLLIVDDVVIDPAMFFPCRDKEIECLAMVTDNARIVHHMPRDQNMIMDAANCLRCNDDILFLRSNSGNQAAYQWLCDQLPHKRIHLVDFYAGVHIDSTLMPLKEGLIVVNASRVTESSLPEFLHSWDKIWVHDVEPQGFYQYPYASKWIAMNMLSISPDTVIVDAAQTQLISEIERQGLVAVPLTLRHSRTLGGGFHCTTLDIRRL